MDQTNIAKIKAFQSENDSEDIRNSDLADEGAEGDWSKGFQCAGDSLYTWDGIDTGPAGKERGQASRATAFAATVKEARGDESKRKDLIEKFYNWCIQAAKEDYFKAPKEFICCHVDTTAFDADSFKVHASPKVVWTGVAQALVVPSKDFYDKPESFSE